jgi:hypothetical protein
MKIYVAGPMRGIKDFNFPAFHRATFLLRALGHSVFNPAERDEDVHGKEIMKTETGDLGEAVQKGFSLREAFAADMKYIALEADAVFMLRGWAQSKGAKAEVALAEALELKIFHSIEEVA